MIFFTREKMHAFLLHLAFSIIIFIVLLYFILVYWYPHPLFGTDGGWQGIQLIAAVDIILGPLLTLIVYKKGKPRLKLDLAMIVLVQFAALFSGTWVVYNEHPALVVFVEDRFKPITAYQANEAGISLSSVERAFERDSGVRPPVVFVELPGELDALQALRAQSFRESRPLSLFGELYRPLTADNKHKIRQSSIDMDNYLADKPQDMIVFKQFKNKHKNVDKQYMYVPILSRYDLAIVVVDPETIRLIDVLDIRPPQYQVPTELLEEYKKSIDT